MLKDALTQYEMVNNTEECSVKMELVYYARLPNPLTHENHVLLEVCFIDIVICEYD